MTQEQLNEILENHKHWIYKNCDGWENMKADLSGANLYEADLSGADLYGANLSGANLSGANLYEADLSGANLSGANLSRTDLYGTDLRGANLYGVNLYGTNLYGADLYGANLSRTDLYGAKLPNKEMNKYFPQNCPEEGSFIGWKKVKDDYIVKLQITENAKRSSGFGRKCRCSEALVLSIENLDGTPCQDIDKVYSNFDLRFAYKVGEIVSVPNFDENRMKVCSTGIHFFITRQEAVDYR